MLHKYRKTSDISAERFDGSDEMVSKYELMTVSFPEGKETSMYVLTTRHEGLTQIKVGDYIATDADGEHWVIDKDIFERTYERCDDR
ncbi:MAG: hypothetical protein ACI4UB_02695 [Limosilactobacillus sp.]